MTRPTRQEQAQSILRRRAWQLASQVLGRRATNAADFTEAFNLERIDLIAEIPNAATMLSLGANQAGPRDGLYVIDDGGSYRVYLQERGIPVNPEIGLTFGAARDAAIDSLILLNGIPFSPEG